MRKFYTFCILLLCIVVFPNQYSQAANYWKDYGSTFVLNHPWLKVKELAISSDSKILNIKTQSDSLYQFDMETGEIFNKFLPTISKISKDWKFSEDGDYVIFADMITWDEASYKHLLDFKFYSQKIDKSNHVDSLQYKLENKKYLFANTPGGYQGSDIIYKYDPTRHLFFINLAEHIELSHLPYPVNWSDGPCIRGFNVVFKLDSQKFEIKDHFYMDGYKINETYDRQNMMYYYSGTNALNAIDDGSGYPNFDRYQFENTFQYEIDLRTFKLVKNKHVEDSNKVHIVSVYNDSIDYTFRAGHKLKIDQTDLPIQISKYINNQKIDSIEFNYKNHNSFFPLAQNLLLTKIQNQLYVFDLNEFVIIDSISFPYNDNYKFANQKLIFFNGANIYKMNFKYYSTNTLVEILPNESTFTNHDSLNIRFVSNQNIKDFTWEIEKNEISQKSFKYRFLTKGNYTISLRYTFDGINYQTITKSVLISEKIKTDFTINKKRYSIDEEVEFTNKSIGDKLKYRWDFGDRAISADVNPTHAYSEPRYYTVKLVAFDIYFKDSIVKHEIVNCEFPEKVKAVSVSFSDSLEIAKKLINTIADTSRQDYRLSYIFCSDLIGSAFYVNYDESYWYYNDCIRLNGYARTYNYGIAYKNGMRYPIQFESEAIRLNFDNIFYSKFENKERINILADSASKVFDKNSKDSIWVYNNIKSTFDLPSEYGIRHLLKNSFIWAKYNSYNTIEGIYEYDSLRSSLGCNAVRRHPRGRLEAD